MDKYSTRKIGSAITYILLLLLLAAVVGVVYHFTNGFKTEFTTFYVQQGDTMFYDVTDDYPVPFNEETRFDVKYTFGVLDKELSGYSVKIVPNVSGDKDFDFTVDGLYYSYGGETDLTSAFDLKQYDDYFTLFVDDTMTMKKVLEKLYTGKTVVVPDNVLNDDYFTIVVSSYNGKSTVYINFLFRIPVTGITLV
ncbi:hypothetical protein AGMMS50249_5910 [candidate division SR1 bacterium]|nr:hypothetical protein AGMMS50249_5910 [candidate division SR1 bacterium]